MDSSLRVRLAGLVTLLVALVGVGVILARFYRETAEVTTLVIPPEVAACEGADDCGIANQIGCCPCELGGGQGAVNPRRRAQLKAFLQAACHEGVPCVELYACRDDLRAACRAGRCILIPGEGPGGGDEKRS